MAGRKPIFDREEQRKNQVVVPMSEQEKKQGVGHMCGEEKGGGEHAAKAGDRSGASLGRRVRK